MHLATFSLHSFIFETEEDKKKHTCYFLDIRFPHITSASLQHADTLF